jgi:hypothetical protein
VTAPIGSVTAASSDAGSLSPHPKRELTGSTRAPKRRAIAPAGNTARRAPAEKSSDTMTTRIARSHASYTPFRLSFPHESAPGKG